MSTNQQILTGFINTHEDALPILEKQGEKKRLSFNFVYKKLNELNNIHVIATNQLADQLLTSINKDNIKGFSITGEIKQINALSYFKANSIEPHPTIIISGVIQTIATVKNESFLTLSLADGQHKIVNVTHLNKATIQNMTTGKQLAIYGQMTPFKYDGQCVIHPWQITDNKEKLQTKKPSQNIKYDVSQGL